MSTTALTYQEKRKRLKTLTAESLTIILKQYGTRKAAAKALGVSHYILSTHLRRLGLAGKYFTFPSQAEYRIANIVRRCGIQVKWAGYYSPYGYITDSGIHLECKTSQFINGHWLFNIHRHGRLQESEVDVYILQLEACPLFGAPIYLALAAPLCTKTIWISPRSLLSRYSQSIFVGSKKNSVLPGIIEHVKSRKGRGK